MDRREQVLIKILMMESGFYSPVSERGVDSLGPGHFPATCWQSDEVRKTELPR